MAEVVPSSQEARPALLACKDLTIGYEGVPVLEKLNFEVNAGNYLYIVGENGSGKSTLMKTILGLTQPLSGRVTTGGGLKRSEIGYLTQQTAVQKDFPASVREVVLSGCLNRMGLRPFYSRAEKDRAAHSMERLGLTGLAGKCYRELSGGQQQRVLLARALCATQKLLMLDEPVTGLDPNATAGMYDLIASLNGEGVTVVMISHDLSAAERHASHILHLTGHGWFFGTREEYLSSDVRRRFAPAEGGER